MRSLKPSFLWFRDFWTCSWAPSPIIFTPGHFKKSKEMPTPPNTYDLGQIEIWKMWCCWNCVPTHLAFWFLEIRNFETLKHCRHSKLWNFEMSKNWNFRTLLLWNQEETFWFSSKGPPNTPQYPRTYLKNKWFWGSMTRPKVTSSWTYGLLGSPMSKPKSHKFKSTKENNIYHKNDSTMTIFSKISLSDFPMIFRVRL